MNNFTSGVRYEIENQTSKPNPPPTLPLGRNYEVFLSFRGEETRLGFTDHLYRRLVDAGILVFRDSEELRVGETIAPELVRAIKGSKISIPIISPDYASSKWCLNELAQILDCMKSSGQRVLPIFYKVKPTDVRYQKGNFGKAFKLYNRKHGFDSELVGNWKNALIEVSSLKGWESNKVANGHEGELVKIVVTRVLKELRKAILVVPNFLVGVDDHVQKIMKMIDDKPTHDVKIIEIFGTGGIGKTTLAKVIYNKLSDNFECSSFVPNIREASSQYRGIEDCQKQLISDILMDKSSREISNVDEGISIIRRSFEGKKLLLLLDDVENRDQLNKLAPDPGCFGPQSIIIITTRHKEIIEGFESSLHYELNELDFDQSFQLFCKHACQKDNSLSVELDTIAKDIVRTTGGLPLAIEVIGSLLFKKSENVWEVTLKKLKRIPNDRVLEKLRVSYDALNHEEQQIFLDIACLPITEWLEWWPRKKGRFDYALYMCDDCEFYPEEGIHVLISLSLIKIGDENQVIIHDQLRDLGREIVRREGYHELGKCSRLWIPEEATEVIQQKLGTDKVQALCLDCEEEFTNKHFENLTNLRFLRMKNTNLVGDFRNSLSKLRWLEWDGFSNNNCCVKDFMETIQPKKLVILHLSYFELTEQCWGQIMLARRLKVLNLCGCCNFTTTPDFSTLRELEVLNLSFCKKLRKIHPSICNLSKTLKFLDVRFCNELEELPLDVGKMEELREFRIDSTIIREIRISEGFVTKLETLSADFCKKLMHIPDMIGKLKSLTELHLGRSVVTQIPYSIGELHNLKDTPIKGLPTTIGMLSALQILNLEKCRELESLPNLPSSLTSLAFCGHSMETLPDMSYLTNLKDLKYSDAFERRNRTLHLGKLNQLNNLQIYHLVESEDWDINDYMSYDHLVMFGDGNLVLEIPSSLVKLEVFRCETLRCFPNMIDCKRLSEINLEYCHGLTEISGLGVLVTELTLRSCSMLKSLPHLATAKNLKRLIISKCSNLVEITGLDNIEGLQYLNIDICPSLERIGDLSNLKMLKSLLLQCCQKLSDVEGIDKLTSLEHLTFNIYNSKVEFPDLSMLRNLTYLSVANERLVEIPGLQELKSLVELDIHSCKSLQYLPDFSLFTNLKEMTVEDCSNLTRIEGLENLKCLQDLYIYRCPLIDLPNLPEKCELRN